MENKLTPAMTAVDILLYIQKHQSDFPNLQPTQVLARLPEKDARYQQGKEGG